jgi:transaldolase
MARHARDDYRGYLREMRSIARGIIHVQVTTEDSASMIAEGEAIHACIEQVRVKIPVTVEGLKAMEALSAKGIECAATAVNTVTMAVLAARAGAASVIPYYGVMEDFEEDATGLLADIVTAFRTYGWTTEMIYFARNVKEVRTGIRAGATGCLMTLEGLRSLFDHPLSKREVDFMNLTWRQRFGDRTWAEG